MRPGASLYFFMVLSVFGSACGTDADSAQDRASSDAAPAAEQADTNPTVQPSTATTGATTTGATTTTVAPAEDVQPCADVIDATIEARSDGSFRLDATVRSGDSGWDKYADAWEVRQLDGTVLGVRELAHPHETEQPFTRSLSLVEIPAEVDQVVLAANDSVNGFCGDTLILDVPR